MAKTYKRQPRENNDYWDDEQPKTKRSDVNRIRQKRIKSALRSKDVDSLMRYDEE